MTLTKNYLALAVMTAVSTAQASDALPQEPSQEKAKLLGKIVVSATRTQQNINNVSSSVASVSEDDLNTSLATNIQDAVKFIPGVSVAGMGRFGLNGFTIRGMDESRVKVMVDGVEQPQSYNPGAAVMRFQQNMYETDTLAAIEIHKGPASSLYGSDALGGAVMLHTKNPEDFLNPSGDDTYADVKTGYRSANQSFKQTLSFANRTDDWESLLIYTHNDGKATKTHGGADINGRDRGKADPYDFSANNVLGKLFYQLNPEHRFGVTAERYHRKGEGRILSNEGYAIMGMSAYTYTNNYGKDDDTRQRIGFEHQWAANTALFDQLQWSLNWQKTKSDHDTQDHTPALGNRVRHRIGTDTSYQLDVQFDKTISGETVSHNITYGISGIKDNFALDYFDTNLDTGAITSKNPEIPEADSTKWGAYIQDQASLLNDTLIITTGLRFDDFKATPKKSAHPKSSNHAYTGKLGAVYHWNDNISTFAQFSQGFKAPTLQDLYYFYNRQSGGVIVKPNPDLKAEKSNAYELGLRGHSRFGTMELTGFLNDYRDFIEEANYSQGTTTVYTKQNVGKAQIYGAEFSGQLYLDEAMDAPTGTYSRLSIAYTKGKNKDNDELLNTVAPLTTVLGFGYDAPAGNWGSALDITHVDGKTDSDWALTTNAFGFRGMNVDASAYTLVDITGYYHPAKDITLRGGLFNAFDKKYWLYQDVNGVTSNQGLNRRTQPGRNWGVDLEYQF